MAFWDDIGRAIGGGVNAVGGFIGGLFGGNKKDEEEKSARKMR